MNKRYILVCLSTIVIGGILLTSVAHVLTKRLYAVLETYPIHTMKYGTAVIDVQKQSITDSENIFFGPLHEMRVLQNALQLAEAIYHPPLAIVGTDPVELLQSVQDLDSAQQDIANLQDNVRDEINVSEVLYPTQFLTAIAHAEIARLGFIENPNKITARTYERMLQHAIRIGTYSAYAFSDAMNLYLNQETIPTLYSPAGQITKDSLAHATERLQHRFKALQEYQRQRRICRIVPTYTKCANTLQAIETIPELNLTTSNTYIHIRDVLMQVLSKRNISPHNSLTFQLNHSVCAKEIPGVHHYLTVATSFPDGARTLVYFLDELFFSDTQENGGDVLNTLAAHGVRYAALYPTNFYLCPHSQNDRGTLLALRNIAHFAQAHPHIAPELQHQLLSTNDVLRENIVRRYLDAALRQTRFLKETDPMKIQINQLHLQLYAKHAGLDALIKQITHVLQTLVTKQAYGLSNAHVSARKLFLTHSAFPSLFLTHDTVHNFNTVNLITSQTGSIEDVPTEYIRYSQIRGSVSDTELINDVLELLRYDGYLN